MKKTLGLIISSIIIALILLLISLGINHFRPTVTPIITPAKPCVKQIDEKITVILDAGHGGIDSGAVGVSGVYEKDLHGIGSYHQLGFQCAWGGIIAGVDDGAVGLGGVAADVLILFHHDHIHLVLGKLTSYSAAYRTGADDHNICF